MLMALIIGGIALPRFQHATIVIEWTTASELDTAGFNIYRSDSPDGEFVRINQTLIPASPDPLTGGSYEFKDPNVTPGKTYYYVLEDVDNNGLTHRSQEVVKAKAERGGQLLILVAVVFALTSLFILIRNLRGQRLRSNSQTEEN